MNGQYIITAEDLKLIYQSLLDKQQSKIAKLRERNLALLATLQKIEDFSHRSIHVTLADLGQIAQDAIKQDEAKRN